MPGTWEGTPQRQALVVTFEISGGSAVMSEIHGDHDMISMINLDGPDRLLLTHYCAAGNQPRMAPHVSPDGKTITFTYVDATNLATPDAGHMQKMVRPCSTKITTREVDLRRSRQRDEKILRPPPQKVRRVMWGGHSCPPPLILNAN